MKKSGALVGIFIFLILSGCKSIDVGIDDIDGLWINNVYENGHDVVKVYGRIMDNTYVYNKFVILRNVNSINLLVYGKQNYFDKNEDRNFNFVSHSRKINKGDFYISVLIDNDIDNITFGNDMIIIWERKSDEALEMREGLLELEYNTSMDDIAENFGVPDGMIIDTSIYFHYSLKNYRKAILKFHNMISSVDDYRKNDGREDYRLIEIKEISNTGKGKVILP